MSFIWFRANARTEHGINVVTGIEEHTNIITTTCTEGHTAHGPLGTRSGEFVSRQPRDNNYSAGVEFHPCKRTSPMYRSGYKRPSSS